MKQICVDFTVFIITKIIDIFTSQRNRKQKMYQRASLSHMASALEVSGGIPRNWSTFGDMLIRVLFSYYHTHLHFCLIICSFLSITFPLSFRILNH